MLKTIARMLPGLIAVALGTSLARVSAEPLAGDPGVAPSRGVTGQDDAFRFDDSLRRTRPLVTHDESAQTPSSLGDPKSQAKLCIFKARQELAQRNTLAADYWYHESLKYQAVFAPGEDSPEKLAADIRRAGSGISDGARTSGVAAARGVVPLPPIDGDGPAPTAFGRGPVVAGGLTGASRRDMSGASPAELLLSARRALALGDVRRAKENVQQAKSANVQYRSTDDTPDRVETLIGRYSDLMAQRNDRGNTDTWRRDCARMLMEQADGLLRWRDLNEAERMAREAQRLHVQFSPYEQKPETLLDHVAAIRRDSRSGGVVQAEAVMPATGNGFDGRADRAVYDPTRDPTRNVLANNQEPTPAGPEPAPAPGARIPMSPGMTLFQQGEAALRAHNTPAALQLFRQAYQYFGDLDPDTARRLQDHLQSLQAAQAAAAARPPVGTPTAVDEVAAKQQLLARQIAAEVSQAEGMSQRQRETDPKAALLKLEQVRSKVESAGLDGASRDQLLRRIDRDVADVRKYIAENRPRIEQDEHNQQVRQQLDRQRQNQMDVQTKIASKIDEYNTLLHEQRFAEAEVVAKQCLELAPENGLAQQIVQESKIRRAWAAQMDIKDRKEQGVLGQLEAVDEASIPFDDRVPYVLPDAKKWKDLSSRRAKYGKEQGRRLSEREVEIRNKLKTPVSLQFENAPLSKVMDSLAQLAGINLYLDPQGLAEEGVSSDTPININIPQEIKLESALNLILRPLRLTHLVKNEVLNITSEQARRGEVYQVVYPVADLVIPIPNFVPHNGMGLEGAIMRGMATANNGYAGMLTGSNAPPLAVVASRDGRQVGGMAVDPTLMAQMSPGGRGLPTSTPVSRDLGNLGGAGMANFDPLIDLIEQVVEPDSWQDTGAGQGTISEFDINLSLVVSNTQEVHDKIVDLLEQLRRMQDLQVTIEVRFITLNDTFFERIGVDFNWKIQPRNQHAGQIFGAMVSPGTPGDPSGSTGVTGTPATFDTRLSAFNGFPGQSSTVVGFTNVGNNFTSDLDIPFNQGSFGLAVPPISNASLLTGGLSTGFAILSDIEATFFLQAAQGDQRTNILQAPKVTLFNGQQAMVMDMTQTPFVTSVTPYVGDFAVGQQPVITILSEGTFLTVQAVVSNDKRFVRLTLVPLFSHITKVDTFTFTGTSTTVSDTSTQGVQAQPNDNSKANNKQRVTTEGTTVQQPTFATVSVTTTVSVPDGGTVLMGGIKRLSEGRNEFGVPLLNKIPYINRLFKNVGTSRETESLMMMVTPRIIIQEEEEQALLGTASTP